ncbi:MAG: gliding motility-associated ABC transporter substrate-binding protein GldG [Bacteroidales bacterium]|nr:gliding motility-associated ABC transporter substrate-binding protein GldG [Bacteroidales bacterium]
MKTKQRNKVQSFYSFSILLISIIALNIIVQYSFFRIDLTTDKRYSLSESTKEKIKSLEDIIFIKVYLEGDLPADFKMLRNATKELLDEFRAYNTNIQYEFINPSANEDKNERFKVYRQLASEGLAYYSIPVENKDGFAQKTIFTGAQITYNENSIPINLLVSSRSVPTNADINNSIHKLELTLLTAIHYLTTKQPKTIAFTTGHGELDNLEIADFAYELSQSYHVSQVEIHGKINALSKRIAIDSSKSVIENKFDLIIIAKPDSTFDERDKFVIDQYIMHGGKVIWLLDNINVSMDSLRQKTTTIGLPVELNLDDMLFKYGVRLKQHLVLNRNALEIGTAEGALRRWDYFPLALPASKHLITNNINSLKTQFVNSIDTIANGIGKKTVILKTDNNCRLMPSPAIVDVEDIIYRRPNPALYTKPAQNLGVIIEGSFKSNFENRIGDPRIINNPDFHIKFQSPPTKMAFFADGDLIRNQIMEQNSGPFPLPLGYDRFTRKMFDNKKFLLNTVNYMLDDNSLIELRSKEFKIRLLDKTKVTKNRLFWQILNTATPLIFVILMGLLLLIFRNKIYARKNTE